MSTPVMLLPLFFVLGFILRHFETKGGFNLILSCMIQDVFLVAITIAGTTSSYQNGSLSDRWWFWALAFLIVGVKLYFSAVKIRRDLLNNHSDVK